MVFNIKVVKNTANVIRSRLLSPSSKSDTDLLSLFNAFIPGFLEKAQSCGEHVRAIDAQ